MSRQHDFFLLFSWSLLIQLILDRYHDMPHFILMVFNSAKNPNFAYGLLIARKDYLLHGITKLNIIFPMHALRCDTFYDQPDK